VIDEAKIIVKSHVLLTINRRTYSYRRALAHIRLDLGTLGPSNAVEQCFTLSHIQHMWLRPLVNDCELFLNRYARLKVNAYAANSVGLLINLVGGLKIKKTQLHMPMVTGIFSEFDRLLYSVEYVCMFYGRDGLLKGSI